MGTQKDLLKELLEFKKNVNKDFPLQRVILFGSRATKKFKEQSDVDLIIVSSAFKKFDFIERGARMYNYWVLPYSVDFLCYSVEEFTEFQKGISIVSEAVKEGVEI